MDASSSRRESFRCPQNLPDCPPSNSEASSSIKSSGPSVAEHASNLRTQASRAVSPAAREPPFLVQQPNPVCVSDHSFRSTSALDGIQPNLLRRYPRFSTAVTSIDTGRPSFSVHELTSTELSDDENDMVNHEPTRKKKGVRWRMKHNLAKGIHTLWNANVERFRDGSLRLRNNHHHTQGARIV